MIRGDISMLKKIAIFTMILGFAIIAFSGYYIWDGKQKEAESIARAEALLDEGNKSKEGPKKTGPFEANFGDEIGMLQIDKIDANIAIVEGTHEDELRHGVGHYSGTAFPEEDDQVVLSGHRDTVFQRMGELDEGDIITVRMPYGVYEYEIFETFITDADDRTVIVPHDEEVLTVTTCYPFSYIGSAPDRYIINAKPVYKD